MTEMDKERIERAITRLKNDLAERNEGSPCYPNYDFEAL